LQGSGTPCSLQKPVWNWKIKCSAEAHSGYCHTHNVQSKLQHHTHLCSLRTYDLSTPWIVVTVSRTIVPLPGNISSFFFVTTSWKCFRANCTCSRKRHVLLHEHRTCELYQTQAILHLTPMKGIHPSDTSIYS
jgi:hypothetical protein